MENTLEGYLYGNDSNDPSLRCVLKNNLNLYTDDSSSSDTMVAKCSSSTSRTRNNSFDREKRLDILVQDHNFSNVPPPIGVFWDIENIQVPKGKSALSICQIIRQTYFKGYREAEFLVVCDVTKELPSVIKELNEAQVNTVHVPATCKNAADDKLRQCMRRFADTHGHPSTIILISKDVNFSPDLSDLRHRNNIHIILLYDFPVPESLVLCAHEHYNFTRLLRDMAWDRIDSECDQVENNQLLIFNLPTNISLRRIVNRLHQLSGNCGGKVICTGPGYAILKFANVLLTSRAIKRLEGEDVFGNKIIVIFTNRNFRVMRNKIYLKYRNKKHESESYQEIESKNSFNRVHRNFPEAPLFHQEAKSTSRVALDTLADDSSSGYYSEFGVHQDCSHNTSSWGSSRTNQSYVTQSEKAIPKLLDSSPNITRTTDYLKSRIVGNRCTVAKLLCSNNSAKESEIAFCSRVERWTANSTTKCPPLNSLPKLNKFCTPVELLVSNLDQSIDAKELRRSLCSLFQQFIKVLYLNVTEQSDGNLMAIVKVQSMSDAQYAISQLHRQKLGSRRITISYARSRAPQLNLLTNEVQSLLYEIPGRSLPLFKFRELFEKRYHHPVSLSELYRMKDITIENQESIGRMVTLDQELHIGQSESLDSPYCRLHTPHQNDGKGWAEKDFNMVLPNVNIRVVLLGERLSNLLGSHPGPLSLASLPDCYKAEYSYLEVDDVNGVSLEHLVSCIPEFHITLSPNGYKRIERNKLGLFCPAPSVVSPHLQTPVNQFCREVVDLLKASHPRSQIPFCKFIPVYHNHFGRQCRVADYGYTKLIDLLNAVPEIIQIIGEGTKRIVTLSHKIQVKRFIGDVLKVLKAQTEKRILLSNFPSLYEKINGRVFNVIGYGVCDIHDLLNDVSDSAFTVKRIGEDFVIYTEKREQTSEQLTRIVVFRAEVEELLRHAPCYQMNFNKFIPSYHHHFSRQCRISDYGFSKLMELFEAIPDVVEIVDEEDDEKTIQLTLGKRVLVFSDQVNHLLKVANKFLTLDELSMEFVNRFGFCIHLGLYGARTLEDLLRQIESLQVLTRKHLLYVGLKTSKLDFFKTDAAEACLEGNDNNDEYDVNGDDEDESSDNHLSSYGASRGVLDYSKIPAFLEFMEKAKLLLFRNNGKIPFLRFEEEFQKKFNCEYPEDCFGYGCLEILFKSLPGMFLIVGSGVHRQVCLVSQFIETNSKPFKAPLLEQFFQSNMSLHVSEGDVREAKNSKYFDSRRVTLENFSHCDFSRLAAKFSFESSG